MNSVTKLMLTLALPAFSSANAGTLYLCQSYGGGQFWSGDHCHNHSAIVKRMVTVPDNLPFDQQVQLGEQKRAEGRQLVAPASPPPSDASRDVSTTSSQCAGIAQQIKSLDAMARQPQSMQTQDYIRHQRKKLSDAQFRLHC